MTSSDMDIRALVFDKDGTLFDFTATWGAWASGLLLRLAEGNRTHAAELADLIGYDFDNCRFDPDSIVIADTPDAIVDVLAPALPRLSEVELLTLLNDEAAKAPMVEAVPLQPFLSGLKQAGLVLGVVTNDAEAPAHAHLNAVGVRDAFDFIAGSDSGFGAKPEPGQLHAFCDAVGVAAKHAIMVGDSAHDLIAGRAAGMKTAAVLTGVAMADDLQPHADIVLPDIGHLPEWIGLGGK